MLKPQMRREIRDIVKSLKKLLEMGPGRKWRDQLYAGGETWAWPFGTQVRLQMRWQKSRRDFCIITSSDCEVGGQLSVEKGKGRSSAQIFCGAGERQRPCKAGVSLTGGAEELPPGAEGSGDVSCGLAVMPSPEVVSCPSLFPRRLRTGTEGA